MKQVTKEPRNPSEIEVVNALYRYKPSIEKISQMTKALNLYHTKCKNAAWELCKRLKEYYEKPFRLVKRPQDPIEIEIITKFYSHKSSVDKIEYMVKALDKYHTRCSNAAKALAKALKEIRQKPVKKMKVQAKHSLKKK